MKYSHIIVGFSLLCLNTCDLRPDNTEPIPLARVNDARLYKTDIDFSFVQGQSKPDSIIYVQNIINNWATTQLLIDGANLNLSKETQTEDATNASPFMSKTYLEYIGNPS